MQEDLLERFRTIAASDEPSPADRAERLEQLAGEQGRLAELTMKLSKPEPDNLENDLEKLPDVRKPPEEASERDAAPAMKEPQP